MECTVSLNFDAFLPDSYVPFPAQRMALYKKIALIASDEDLSDVTDELVDRFGEPPLATQNLLQISLIHNCAIKCGITAIRQDGGEIHIYPQSLDIDIWSELSDTFGRLRILMSGDPHICLRLQKGDQPLALIHKMFEKYLEIRKEKA